MKLNWLKLIVWINFAFSVGIANATDLFPATCNITNDGIANIKLGTRLNQIKTIYPNAKIARTTDGDGVALVSVDVGKQFLAVIYAGEDDSYSVVNFSNKIEYIETLHPKCKTAAGIHVGMSVKKAAQILGGIKEISQSEIEAREYVEFKKPSKNLIYRIDYCGSYKNNSRRTKNYEYGCTIFSIAVSN